MPVKERKGYKKKIRESVPEFNLDICYKYELIANFYFLEKYFINGNDLDNLEKGLKDALQPKLGLDDNCFYRSITQKIEVYSESEERIEFAINKMGLSYFGRRAKEIAEYVINNELVADKSVFQYLRNEFGWCNTTINSILKTSVFQTMYCDNMLFK